MIDRKVDEWRKAMQHPQPIGSTATVKGRSFCPTMAAAISNNYKGSKLLFSFILTRRTMTLKSYCTLALVICSLGRCFAEDDHHEMEEFLKREFSLTKPYQGIAALISQHSNTAAEGGETGVFRITHYV